MIPSLSWMDDALCAQIPAFLDLQLAEQAVICITCPVRERCSDFAERTGSTDVMFGGRIQVHSSRRNRHRGARKAAAA